MITALLLASNFTYAADIKTARFNVTFERDTTAYFGQIRSHLGYGFGSPLYNSRGAPTLRWLPARSIINNGTHLNLTIDFINNIFANNAELVDAFDYSYDFSEPFCVITETNSQMYPNLIVTDPAYRKNTILKNVTFVAAPVSAQRNLSYSRREANTIIFFDDIRFDLFANAADAKVANPSKRAVQLRCRLNRKQFKGNLQDYPRSFKLNKISDDTEHDIKRALGNI